MSITAKHATAHPKLSFVVQYQSMLPPELWTLILERLPPTQLFTIYNVSRFMRSLAGPLLTQVIATMSPRLFFYQEYVRRIGIRFIFEGFDLEHDVVVFRPLNVEHQHRFRNERTLQCPQLEEITISALQEAPRVRRHKTHPNIFVTEHSAKQFAHVSSQQQQQSPSPGHQYQYSRRSADDSSDRIFPNGNNFLDRACPLRAKKSGIATLDGTRYSFGKDYPWRLHYQIEGEPLPPTKHSKLRFHEGGILLISGNEHNVRTTIPSGGARYIRALRFECSMNFLNPRRAARNVVGRWIEHKLQQCLRVFGATGSGYPLHHHRHRRSPQEKESSSDRPSKKYTLSTSPPSTESSSGGRRRILRRTTSWRSNQEQQITPLFGMSSSSAHASHFQDVASMNLVALPRPVTAAA